MGKINEENEYVKNVREELKPELSKLSKDKVLDFSFSYELSKFLYEYMEKNVYGKYGSSPDEMVKFLDACIYILESSEMQKYLETDSYVFLDIFEEKEKALYKILQQNSEYKNIISPKSLKTSPFPLSQLYCMRGFVLSRSGKENEAMESYKNALKYNFLAETINYYYCEGCIISNKFELLEEGLKKFYEVAHTEKQIFLYYVLLGEWYVYRQEFDKALASYTIASQISSEDMPGTGINTIIEKYGDCWSDKLKNDMKKLSFDYFGRNLISKSAVTVLLNCAGGINAPQNANYKFLDRDTIDINNYWPTTFANDNSSSWGWKVGGYPWNRLADSFMITNSTEDEDKNIYLYNYCDAKIYAHDSNEEYVESFEDMSSFGGFDAKNSNLICDDAAQESFAYGYNFDGSTGGKECKKGYWWLFPKIRFKNTYVTQTDKWNNLKQFRNGYLSYQSISGNTKYPRYYGGLPLFNVNVNNPLSASGTIKIVPTSASYTNANMKLWIKDGEFLNNSDISSYSETEKAKIKILSAPGCTFDNTEKCLLIPKNTNVTVTITAPKKNEEYFLRVSEVGSTYGGEIKYLDDFVIEMDN